MKESMPFSIRLTEDDKKAIMRAGGEIKPQESKTFTGAVRALLEFYETNRPKKSDEDILNSLQLQIDSMKKGPLKLSDQEIQEMEQSLEKAKQRVLEKKKNHFHSQLKLVSSDS